MPHKPPKSCAHPGCPNLTYGRYCEVHQKEADRNYDRYQRNPEHKERYHSKGWKAIRRMQLVRQPLCEMCLAQGRYTRASLVHHIRPLEEGGGNEADNLMSLCAPCHSRWHAEHGDRWHNHKTKPE